MVIVEFLQTLGIAVLMGFLTLSTGITEQIDPHENTDQISQSTQTHTESTQKKNSKNATSLAQLRSEYEFGGVIPQILIEHTAYQEASVGTAGTQATTAENGADKKTPKEQITDSLVNIFCQHKKDGYIRTTTGTGFFIHKNGVVLTNAHVAQFLLLEEIDAVKDAHCILRGGDPARPLYEARLLYLPPAWISENAKLVEVENPSGTGERDYALLYASGTLEESTLPETFPALSVDTSLLPRTIENASVLAAGYPAEIIYAKGVDAMLAPKVATTAIDELYTFGSNYADVFSLQKSDVGERGASGGPVVNETGDVIGLIVTKGSEKLGDELSLRALTLSYIDRTIKEETGFTLEENIRGDLERRGKIFKEALIPFLSEILARNM